MMENSKYNKIKILADLSALSWFIEKHALHDAQKVSDIECVQLLNNLKKDTDKYITLFEKDICNK